MTTEPELLVQKRGAVGVMTLNRPAALNALTLDMVRLIDEALDAFEADHAVKSVVIRGAGGKAFCAGGDIRKLHDAGKAGDLATPLAFWAEEYRLNQRIKSYPKPYVALVDGICMGGGVGVSEHGTHRIAGDRYLYAMPEVGIGFFPDVGATYFLPRLPGKIGVWLGVTGDRVKAGDAVSIGLADAYVPSDRHEAFLAALAQGAHPDAAMAAERVTLAPTLSAHDRSTIDACFDHARAVAILAALDAAAAGSSFAAKCASAMRTKSPTSMAIALRQCEVGARVDFAEAMRIEYRIVSRVARGHDFYEGVRALIIDKDNAPRWAPASSQDVTDAAIDAYFAPLGVDELRLRGDAP
ncbi:MAG: enoyl-CoA hydratase/isomerase family protein [Rhodoblastus sp.]|nr:MAG: enoyl-CoA hydratase/isomerase family protein [Rhodoblastus sp.]